ncbi:MAG: DUF6340 family protein [Phocaeicola sp.]
MQKTKNYLFSLFCLVVSSCGSSMQLVSFEQLEAAQMNFPETVKKVAVVNNIPVSDYELNGREIPLYLQGDGRIASTEFAELLAASHYFDEVILSDSTLQVIDQSTGIIPMEKVNQLASEWGVDMLFSIDSLNIANQVASFGYFGAELAAIISPQIKVYVPQRRLPLFSIAKQDTIFWSITPELNSALVAKEASAYVASQALPYIVPYWKKITRSYYESGNFQMRDAALFLREENWEEASLLWEAIYNEKKGAAKARAAYNLALYYEMKEDITKAKELLNEAYNQVKPNSMDASFIEFYLIQLKERDSKLARLKIQMNRFLDK